MSVANGFPPIQGVFYSVFDTEQGSKPVIQVPDGVVRTTSESEGQTPLVLFDDIKNYIIPKPALCNEIVSVLYKGYRVVGHPVHIISENYERNSFTFNFAFIFQDDADVAPYENVISRTANMFKALEMQSHYLSGNANQLTLKSAIDQMFQDLNSFSECQIPIDMANKIDIKLFPILEAPPEIHGYYVPVLVVDIVDLIDDSWNPTLDRLVTYINGKNSVRKIADLAEADYELTKKGIQHLVHYGCVVIIDIFLFSNIYAPTSTVTEICDPLNFTEFNDYCYKKRKLNHSQRQLSVADVHIKLSMKQVFKLYTSFNNGLPVSAWCNQHKDLLQDLDLIRFLEFGILKKIIYMVHSIPIRLSKRDLPSRKRIEEALDRQGLDKSGADFILECMVRPMHFESLCTELRASKTTVANVLKEVDAWVIVNK